MNAIIENSNAAATRAAANPGHKMKWLLKREFWENKGGFFWAPVIGGIVSLVLSLGVLGLIQFVYNKAKNDPNSVAVIGGHPVAKGDVSLGAIVDGASQSDLNQLSDGVTMMLSLAGVLPIVILAFVTFFYFLGSLHEERKDRSILFWKSLPLSDTQTVISKLLAGLVLAPLIAVAVSVAAVLAVTLVSSIFFAFNGGNPFTQLLPNIQWGGMLGGSIAWLPAYWMWSLPTVGWLMLCSAWARAFPFLWAVLIPLGLGIASGIAYLMLQIATRGQVTFNWMWIWEHVIGRALLGLWPGSHLAGMSENQFANVFQNHDIDIAGLTRAAAGLDIFANLGTWVGAAAGIAMIFAAIHLRRTRDDA